VIGVGALPGTMNCMPPSTFGLTAPTCSQAVANGRKRCPARLPHPCPGDGAGLPRAPCAAQPDELWLGMVHLGCHDAVGRAILNAFRTHVNTCWNWESTRRLAPLLNGRCRPNTLLTSPSSKPAGLALLYYGD